MKLLKIQSWLLYIFFFSINFEVWDPFNTGGLFSISKFTGLIYFASILPNLQDYLFIKDIKSSIKNIWLFFCLLTVVSILNINVISQFFFDFSLFQNIVLFWILINHMRRKPDVLEKGLFFFALGSLILSLLFNLGIGVEITGGRVSLFGDNENTIGMRMCFSITIILVNIFHNHLQLNKARFLLLIPIPYMLKLMAETGSRIAFISFIIMFILGSLLLKTKRPIYRFAVLIIGFFGFVVILQYIMESEILLSRLLMSTENKDLAGRDTIWEKLLPLIKDNIFFGVGKTGYINYSNKVFNEFLSPHNVLLEILCYTGIIGLITYLSFFSIIIKKSITAYKINNLFLPILLLIPIIGLLLSGQILTTKIAWIIFSYTIAHGTFLFTPNIMQISKN